MKKEDKLKPTHPRKYPKEVVDKVLSLIREGKTLNELLLLVPCKKSCCKRIARKNSLVIKKEKEIVKK